MYMRRTRVLPQEKTWHIRFHGHVDDLIDFEELLHVLLDVLSPVIFDRGNEDELDLWLDWNAEFASLLFDLDLTNVSISVNERLEEGEPWQETT